MGKLLSIIEFANRTNITEYTVRNMIKDGRLESELVWIGNRQVYKIDDMYVEQFMNNKPKRKSRYNVKYYYGVKPVKYEYKKNELDAKLKKLDAYNKAHGTNISYGYASAWGII